jgi:hypothetical protein
VDSWYQNEVMRIPKSGLEPSQTFQMLSSIDSSIHRFPRCFGDLGEGLFIEWDCNFAWWNPTKITMGFFSTKHLRPLISHVAILLGMRMIVVETGSRLRGTENIISSWEKDTMSRSLLIHFELSDSVKERHSNTTYLNRFSFISPESSQDIQYFNENEELFMKCVFCMT